MEFQLRKTKDKQTMVYKTIYINQNLVDQINKMASDNETSFNNVVISMVEFCLKSSFPMGETETP